jgi:hypothetical protein
MSTPVTRPVGFHLQGRDEYVHAGAGAEDTFPGLRIREVKEVLDTRKRVDRAVRDLTQQRGWIA